jgi:hypothetical protein
MLGRYREVGHACNAGKSPLTTSLIFLTIEVIVVCRRKKKVRLGITSTVAAS